MDMWKRFVVIGLLLSIWAAPAFAWEYTMKGDAEWRYRYWTRTGSKDLFGEMDPNRVNLGINHLVVQPTAGTTNRGSNTFGVLAGENGYGADMTITDYRFTLFPKITVNKAISFAASVNLTSLGIWSDGLPVDPAVANLGDVNSLYLPINDRAVSTNVPNTFVTLQWLKASIKTPILNFSIGYKDSAIGMGLWKHKCNRASASFGVSAHYGPFKIGFSPYFGRHRSAWDRPLYNGAGSMERKEDKRDYFKAAFGEIEYTSGPMVIQFVSDSYKEPSAPSVTGRGVALPAAVPNPSNDVLRYRFALAAKYNNGRFFFNGEVDWFNRWRSGREVGLTQSLVRTGYNDASWLYGVEFGTFAGPSKVTFNYVRAMGDDPSTRATSEDAATSESGITSCYMKPWGFLMYFMYGTGDGFDAAGYGQPTNFHHLGGRWDYALASNLNIGLVYAYAWRDQPTAYRLGGSYRLGIRPFTNDDIARAQGFPIAGFSGHAVPDSARDLGWEGDINVDWKILEHLTWSTTFAYWKPGTWWSYALPNTANIYRQGIVPNANPDNAAGEAVATFGAGRAVDPLVAVETRLIFNF